MKNAYLHLSQDPLWAMCLFKVLTVGEIWLSNADCGFCSFLLVITLEKHSTLYSRPIFLSVMSKITSALEQLLLLKAMVLFGCHANPFIPLILLISTSLFLLFSSISFRSAIFQRWHITRSCLLSIWWHLHKTWPGFMPTLTTKSLPKLRHNNNNRSLDSFSGSTLNTELALIQFTILLHMRPDSSARGYLSVISQVYRACLNVSNQ